MKITRRNFATGAAALGSAAATGTLSSPVFAQAKKPTIAFFVKNVTNPFWKACRIGAEKAAAEFSGKGVPVQVIWKAPLREDDREQRDGAGQQPPPARIPPGCTHAEHRAPRGCGAAKRRARL